MKNYVRNTLFILALFAFIVFTINNSENVSLSLFPLPYIVETSLSIIVVCTFAAGAMFGGFVVYLRSLPLKRKLKKENKQFKNKETSNLPVLL